MWHGYALIEDLGLTTSQRNTLLTALRSLGPATHRQPCMLNHRRARLDNAAMIFEAEFNDDDWSVANIRQRLADLFSVPLASVTSSTAGGAYGPIVTFRYNTADRLRVIAFGGLGSTWEQSRAACLQYLKDNATAWEA